MTQKLATVNAHESIGDADRGAPPSTAEAIRLDLADAWGEMGAAWGVTPAIARVQAYLMARQEPLTERVCVPSSARLTSASPLPKPNRGGSSSASPSRGGSVDGDRRARRSWP